MAESSANPLVYYSYPGLMTDPGEHAALLKGLPAEIPALCRVVQTNLLHIFWAAGYGVELSDERKQEVQIRRISTQLAYIARTDNRLLTVPRPPEKRLVGNCRDFTLMLTTLLRHQGIPARARCGFGAYFTPGKYEDHWVCEYWNADQGRWVLVDAQLDELQVKTLGVTFDPCDVPRDQFLVGGQAWQLCRTGQINPDDCGIFDLHGLWFVRGDMIRDLAALNNMELLPWDSWGIIDEFDDQKPSDEAMALLDHIAALTTPGSNEVFPEIRGLYESDTRLKVPAVIRSYIDGPTPHSINIMDVEALPESVQ